MAYPDDDAPTYFQAPSTPSYPAARSNIRGSAGRPINPARKIEGFSRIRDQMGSNVPWRDAVTARNVDASRARDIIRGQRPQPKAPEINPMALQPSQLSAMRDGGSPSLQPSQERAARDFRRVAAAPVSGGTVPASPAPSATAADSAIPATSKFRARGVPPLLALPPSQKINPATNRPFNSHPSDSGYASPFSPPAPVAPPSPEVASMVAQANKVNGINQDAADLRLSLGAKPIVPAQTGNAPIEPTPPSAPSPAVSSQAPQMASALWRKPASAPTAQTGPSQTPAIPAPLPINSPAPAMMPVAAVAPRDSVDTAAGVEAAKHARGQRAAEQQRKKMETAPRKQAEDAQLPEFAQPGNTRSTLKKLIGRGVKAIQTPIL